MHEKEIITNIHRLKEEIDSAKTVMDRAERDGDLSKAAEFKYGNIPNLAKQLDVENKKLSKIQDKEKFIKDEVDEDDIATVVSKWTNIPVTRLIESEKQKLINMEERIRQRVVGQDNAVDLEIKKLEKILIERGIKITLDDSAKTYIANNGYDNVYGARPLKRLIEKEIKNHLALLMLKGDIGENKRVDISYDKSKNLLIFAVKK